MSRRLPPVHWLRAFEAAARHLSFSGAARELGVTQSAVSQQVKLLEAHLRRPLFHRLPRSLQLTDLGRAYLPAVRDAFDRLEAGTEEVFGRRDRRPLTVKTTPAFGRFWLLPRLPRFLAAFPDIDVRITSSIWPADFLGEDIDLDIRNGTGLWPGLLARRLTADSLFPVCSPRLLDGGPPLCEPADLADHLLLHTLGFEKGWPQWLALAGVADRVHGGRGLQFDTAVLTLELAAGGTGVALGRTCFVADAVAAGRLVAPFTLHLPTDEAFHVVWPERRPDHRHAERFRAWLFAEAAEADAQAAGAPRP